MMGMSVAEMSQYGMYVGAGIATVPATTTLLIASSKAILINLIASTILSVITGGAWRVEISGISLIKVPFLWKVSKISAYIGGTIFAFSFTVSLADKLYHRIYPGRQRV